MSRFRDIKRQARRDLHDNMSIPALYIHGADDPVEVNVRLHLRVATIGDVPGLALAAERRDVAQKIIFQRSEVEQPARNAIVSLEAGEAYRVGDSEETDDEFIAVHVAPLTAAQAEGLPVPEVE